MSLGSLKKEFCKDLVKWPFFKTNVSDFCAVTLFSDQHAQLKNKTENKPQLKKTSVKTLLNDFF